ncbi:hypothetical protein LTR10_022158 [Elasticomyces elasticus]|uniref:F-box domain-containing protein n=1 Tax=Exophiala sideris TaxID=1016849 RepID=A0ABR0IUW1_9EURO|nr:hypothetical protein LTR10_022158 [Elasticomyces elasticus]KAK5021200.1 hypothetical protein LTS07_011196 [Exophiala sideris]KAK5023773.1 hypothetical protein LTR13_011082 [Exophiala sideris]KAK5048852.1 hypothetical protein LTR69_011197 [Exophiala sideris]KAK5176358.1 hypothetical protein LTR44_011120 [Eurotiomycetes sp. CCFEE 6388]
MAPLTAMQNRGYTPDLPNEIIVLIIQKCPRATLKNVRLASKSLAQLADPYLWRKIVLVPNDQCILGFVKAMKRSKVVRHVTKLTYDARFGSFFHNIKNIPSGPSLSSKAEKAQGERLLERAAQGRFQPYEDMSVEVAILIKALRMLSNLREIRVWDYEDALEMRGDSSHLKVPFFYHKMCQLVKIDPKVVNFSTMAGSSGRSYTKGVLTAAFSAGNRLNTFKTSNVDGRALFGVVPMKPAVALQQLGIYHEVMENLHTLELAFRNDTLVTTANHIQALQSLLRSAKKLKHLKIRLTDCSVSRYQYSDDELMSDLVGLLETPTGGWVSRPLLPRLETLTIDAGICHDEDLLQFLKIHSSTLRRLELSNITLLGGEDRRECWVKLIKHLKTDLKLASISFSGWFSNGGRQQWFVAKDSIGDNRLKAQVEKYVIDKRIQKCPLEHIAIKANQGDVEKPANGEEYEGDLTWTMVYSKRFGDQMDWQLTVPSFGISANGGGPAVIPAINEGDAFNIPIFDEGWENENLITMSDDDMAAAGITVIGGGATPQKSPFIYSFHPPPPSPPGLPTAVYGTSSANGWSYTPGVSTPEPSPTPSPPLQSIMPAQPLQQSPFKSIYI